MNLGTVMDQLAAALGPITGLRVFPYPPGAVTPPAAIVSYPDAIAYGETYRRGMDRMTVPIVVVVGRVTDRTSRDALAGYCAGSGASSVKAAIDGGTYTALDSATVTGAEFDVVNIAGIDYMAATFSVDVAGTGA